MIDFKDVYAFSDDDKKSALHLQLGNKSITKNELFYGTYEQENIEFKFLQGTTSYDLISCGFAYVYLISDRLFSLLKNNNVSGWKDYSVKAYNRTGSELVGYRGFSVTGKCGAIDNDRSTRKQVIQNLPNAPVVHTHQGLFFDRETWDGSDIFSPEGTYYIFVTKQVKEIIQQASITNVRFTRIEEMENFSIF